MIPTQTEIWHTNVGLKSQLKSNLIVNMFPPCINMDSARVVILQISLNATIRDQILKLVSWTLSINYRPCQSNLVPFLPFQELPILLLFGLYLYMYGLTFDLNFF